MISEISVSPRASNNKARHLFFALLISAVAVSALYIALPLYKGVVGEKVNTDGGHWHTWIIIRGVRH